MFLLADVVWPALYLVDRMAAIEVILLGLTVEVFVFRRLLNLTWRRSLLTTLSINSVSALVGWGFIVAWGWHWADATSNRDRSLGWGTFNPLSWSETCCFAWLVTSLIEWLPLYLIAGKQKRLLWSLLIANFLSVAIAYLSFFVVSASRDPWYPPWTIPSSF